MSRKTKLPEFSVSIKKKSEANMAMCYNCCIWVCYITLYCILNSLITKNKNQISERKLYSISLKKSVGIHIFPQCVHNYSQRNDPLLMVINFREVQKVYVLWVMSYFNLKILMSIFEYFFLIEKCFINISVTQIAH